MQCVSVLGGTHADGAETSVSDSTLFLCEMLDLFQVLTQEIRLSYV
jgi:hypothetical protein